VSAPTVAPRFISINQLQVGDFLHLRWQDELNVYRSPRYAPGSFGCSKAPVLDILRRRFHVVIWIPGRAITVRQCCLVKVDLPVSAGGLR
jgi:hypothetical protein